MSYEFILLEKEPPIGYIYLNTPENLNAVNVENLTELYSALEDCEQDESIRVIVLGAKGRLFSSGGNVKEFLSAGLSISPENIFRRLGIDITDKGFWDKGLDEVETLLQETMKLVRKLGKF
jgi:enoyl-CoA hydratase/carnithine racemase